MSIVHIAGRIGRDAEVRTVGDNKVTNFSVAETVGWGAKKATQWWSCALWGSRGDNLVQYLTKGSAVTVCGEVSVREYDGKDGTRKWELTCRVLDVTLQGSRADSTDSRSGADSAPSTPSSASGRQEKAGGGGAVKDDDFDDDIPF